MQSWDQCKHGSFYFFSWHRMYSTSSTGTCARLRQDPSLVLPYWNWGDPAQRALPVPFRQPANPTNSLSIALTGRPAGVDNGTFSPDSATLTIPEPFRHRISRREAPWATASAEGRLRRRSSTAPTATWKFSLTMCELGGGWVDGRPRHRGADYPIFMVAARQHRPAVEPMIVRAEAAPTRPTPPGGTPPSLSMTKPDTRFI